MHLFSKAWMPAWMKWMKDFASVWHQCNGPVVAAFKWITFLGKWDEDWLSIHPARALFPTLPHRPLAAYSRLFPPPNLSSSAAIPSERAALRWADFSRARLIASFSDGGSAPGRLFACFPHHRYTALHNILSICDTLDLVQWVSCPYCCWSLQFAAEKAWWVFSVFFSLSERQVCRYLSLHYLPLRRTAVPVLPVCLFAAFSAPHSSVFCIQLRTVLLLCVSFQWAGRCHWCHWRSSFCIFYRLFLLPPLQHSMWRPSTAAEPVGNLDLILLLELISSEFIKVQ